MAETFSQTLQQWTELIWMSLPSVAYAVAILVVGWVVARGLRGLLKRILRRGQLDVTLVSFLSHIAYGLALTVVIIAALDKLGVNTTSLAAVLAAAGLAVGLALQGSLANFASGVMLVGLRPFTAGDYVEAGGTEGVVEEVALFFTRLRTGDNKGIVVPNSEITSGTITNYSAEATRRIDLVVGIGYDDDIRRGKEVLEGILADEPRILADPAPVVAVSELADSSVHLVVRPWVKTEDYWPVRWDLTERIKVELVQAGLNIPYPQRDVHLHQAA